MPVSSAENARWTSTNYQQAREVAMAQIVLGLGTSHTPLFTLDSSEWQHRAAADFANPKLNLSDGRWLNYLRLLEEVGPRYADAARPEELQRKSVLCEAALDRLADALEAAKPDVVLIVGDDQGELFGPANQPAFAICHADALVTSDMYGHETSPEWIRKMGRGYLMDVRHTIRGASDYALKLIDGLMNEGVDVATVARMEEDTKAGLGHAFGFIVKRLFRQRSIPMVPLLLNTYYPPNVPTAARCHDIGMALRRVIEADESPTRIAIIASGGLSHFVVDAELDQRVIGAFGNRNSNVLRGLPRCALNSGSSEILNWVLAAGAVDRLAVQWKEYLPLYRTPAGTGVGAAFVIWGDVPVGKVLPSIVA